MDLIKHTIQWCKGEIFEGKMILLFGLLLLIITFSFWKFGYTINEKALIIPMLVLSLLHIGTGITMIYSNTHKQNDYTTSYNKEPEKFRQSELVRAQGFIKYYPLTRYFSIGLILGGFLLFVLLSKATGKSIGLCVMVLGFSVIVIDYFSEERAYTYQNALLNGK